MAQILAVDDEKEVLLLIQNALQKEGHQVTIESDATKINEKTLSHYDLILLDVMMPQIDGFTLCSKIRMNVDCPILFLTAKTMESDVIKGLSLGGDDYITKPFGVMELRARIAAHLRRENREKQNAFSISGLRFLLSSKEIYFKNNLIKFTKSEYEICEYLALNHGQVFSKEKIYEVIYGFDKKSDTFVITEHIKNIRAKLQKYKIKPIETVWGIGYKWKE